MAQVFPETVLHVHSVASGEWLNVLLRLFCWLSEAGEASASKTLLLRQTAQLVWERSPRHQCH